MPIAPDHLLAFALVFLFPVRAALFGYRRLTAAEPEQVPRVRLWLYRQGIAIQWSLAVFTVALWAWQGRPWGSLGLVPRANWMLLGVGVGFAVLIAHVLVQRRKALDDEEALARLRRHLGNVERMMPRSDEELRWFGRLAVTAGICEELLYRGYLIWYFASWMPQVPAALLASAAFGLGHAYQGPRGIAVTTLVGVFMSAVYLLTGSLVACVVIHALMDLHAGTLARAAFAREAAVSGPVVAEAPAVQERES